MTEPASTSSSTCPSASGCCRASCCAPAGCCTGSACDCPCAVRLAKLECRVRRIRICLWIALGVFILLLGIAIGKGSARDEMREHGMGVRMQAMPAMPTAPAMPMMMQQGPGPQMQGAPGNRGPDGPGPDDRGRGGRRNRG